MAIQKMELAGKWVVKNIDGEEKRFSDRNSPAAQEWMRSRSSKKKREAMAEKYSQEWWLLQSGLTPMDRIREDEVHSGLKSFLKGSGKISDYSLGRHGTRVQDGVVCATVEIRAVLAYSARDARDLGLDGETSDGIWVLAIRDPKDPKKFKFTYTG